MVIGKFIQISGTESIVDMKHTIAICFLCLFCGYALLAQERKVAITIDDLLATNTDEKQYEYITDRLLEQLKNYNIQAIGFVNENKLYTNNQPDTTKIELLEKWLKAKMDLGNHTYSHVYIDNTTLEDYERDILKGEIITRPLMERYGKQLKYFRHTQLRTGPTDEYRKGLTSFLHQHGYTIAPVTIDNDEYIYAYCYRRAKEVNDTKLMEKIAQDYLLYMEKIFAFYENLSNKFLGYQVPQILLVHANNLNADFLGELIQMIKKRNYTFITLDEALHDKAYALPDGTHSRGLSWIQRWMISQGQEPESHPSVSKYIQELYQKYTR